MAWSTSTMSHRKEAMCVIQTEMSLHTNLMPCPSCRNVREDSGRGSKNYNHGFRTSILWHFNVIDRSLVAANWDTKIPSISKTPKILITFSFDQLKEVSGMSILLR